MKITLSVLFVIAAGVLSAQEVPTVKFGKISAADFQYNSFPADSNAGAVVLWEAGSSKIKGNNKGWFSLEYKVHRRILIMRNAEFDKANVLIRLYTDGEDEEELDELKAVTYNRENGKITETKLNTKESLFTEHPDKNTVLKKFTLPNVKEGSVIEYEYKITSDFLFNLRPWDFQGDIPRMWTRYSVSIPQFMNYVLIPQNIQQYYKEMQKDRVDVFTVERNRELGGFAGSVPERLNITTGITDYTWVMKDVPAFRPEAFTSSADNYRAGLEFQLSGFLEPLVPQKIMTTWEDLAARLLKREDFGQQLENVKDWWPSSLEKSLSTVPDPEKRARLLFEYVRDHFTCTDHSQLFTETPLKKILTKKAGGVAEINLLLTALCQGAGLQADPVILSTRGQAFVNDRYPVAGRFHYVICRLLINNKEILLDASQPSLGFGFLPAYCYNGTARVVDKTAMALKLSTDLLRENEQTAIYLYADKPGEWSGTIEKGFGFNASYELRDILRKEGRQAAEKKIRNGLSKDLQADSLQLDSLDLREACIHLKAVARYAKEPGNFLYLGIPVSPELMNNPFKSTTRQYPVEMPWKKSQVYTINIEIPKGYAVDEMPKPVLLKLNAGGDALFDYKISQSAGKIMLVCRIDFKRTVFGPDEYELLRNFYAMLVAKLEEQVVLKLK